MEAQISIKVPSLEQELKVRTSDANPAEETHYILVVHGTFVKSGQPGKVSWHHPDPTGREQSNFCGRVAALLADGPLGAESVWRELPGATKPPRGVTYPFYWDGSNTDQGRQQGAQNLAKLIRHIGKNDPAARVHIVAHSHGGNVALKAIELYIQRLGSSGTLPQSWPQNVRDRFAAEHKEGVADVSRWRPVGGVSCWGAMNPFLVVWRAAQGKPGCLERFPYGYYHMWDWCLQLGRWRKYKYLKRKRMTSPQTNVLGKIVFLGTPFYYKHWAKRARFKLTVSLICSFLVGYFLTLSATCIWYSMFGASHFDMGAVAWIAAIIAVFLFAAHVAAWCERTLLRSGNMYHSDKVPWSSAMHALVVQAGKLDEAALALCAEPAARAYLLPLIKRATQSLGWVPFPRPPGRSARLRKWALFVLLCLRTLLINALDLIPRAVLWAIGKLVVVHTFGVLRNVVVGAAFGLDTENMNTASVFAGERLQLGGEPRDVRTWDVRRILAEVEDLSCGRRSGISTGSFGTRADGSPESEWTCSHRWSGCQPRECKTATDGSESESLSRETESAWVTSEREPVETPTEGLVENRTESGFSGTEGPFPEARQQGLYSASASPAVAAAVPGVAAPGFAARLGGADTLPDGSESSYAFLWDEKRLMEASDGSWMFKKLKKQLHRVDHSPLLSNAEFERELRSICCVFERRVAEVRGHFQLAHSTYYRNPVIVGAIAAFLERLHYPEMSSGYGVL